MATKNQDIYIYVKRYMQCFHTDPPDLYLLAHPCLQMHLTFKNTHIPKSKYVTHFGFQVFPFCFCLE